MFLIGSISDESFSERNFPESKVKAWTLDFCPGPIASKKNDTAQLGFDPFVSGLNILPNSD